MYPQVRGGLWCIFLINLHPVIPVSRVTKPQKPATVPAARVRREGSCALSACCSWTKTNEVYQRVIYAFIVKGHMLADAVWCREFLKRVFLNLKIYKIAVHTRVGNRGARGRIRQTTKQDQVTTSKITSRSYTQRIAGCTDA